ncbi:unnamed protein product [Dibothriocephalus latus]|uniref:MPN domain-containing protein n=1 Tax=Dibothriocephalus latus TaxID=60516 RepID=A0A3P7LM59_DIBLA|nr:unnamed protein product [Dibothriocephalus latus]
MKDEINVVGWYHSHPHITPFPSDVDLKIQTNFQHLDRNFIGLIFSVFVTQHNSPSISDKTEWRLQVCIQPRPSASSNFYQVSCPNWKLVSDCIKDQYLPDAEVSVAEAAKSNTDYLKLKMYLMKMEKVVDIITNTMATFVKYLKTGLNMIADARN